MFDFLWLSHKRLMLIDSGSLQSFSWSGHVLTGKIHEAEADAVSWAPEAGILGELYNQASQLFEIILSGHLLPYSKNNFSITLADV